MWYAVVEKATGRLYSTGEEIADPMPVVFKVVKLGQEFDENDKEWDIPTQTFVHRETPEEYRVRAAMEFRQAAEAAADTILAMPGVSKLTVAQQTALRTKLLAYLDPTTGAT